jgi:hypothetical protein
MKTKGRRWVAVTFRSAEPAEAINYADMKVGSTPKLGLDTS